MDINKIVEQITNGLTGNLQTDMEYLQGKIEEYKDNDDILTYISRLTYSILPEEQKEDYANKVFSREEKIEIELQRAAFILSSDDKEKIDIAYELITKVLSEIENEFKAGDTFKYYTFDNYMQFILYYNIFKPQKEIRKANYKYDDIYKMLGYILVEKGKPEEALEVLRKGISWNPVSTALMFELGEAYKLLGELDKYLDVSKRALEFATTKEDIARAYRNIGFYFIEKEEYKKAQDMYLYSKTFSDSNASENELKYIESKTSEVLLEFDKDRIINTLEENKIQDGINDFILQLAYGVGQQALKDEQKDTAKYYFEFIYDFDKDEQIKKIIDSLN